MKYDNDGPKSLRLKNTKKLTVLYRYQYNKQTEQKSRLRTLSLIAYLTHWLLVMAMYFCSNYLQEYNK